MSKIPKELLREFVKEQKFTSIDQILETLREMFREVLQESLEVEFDEQMGNEKYDVASKKTANSRNGYSKKTVKSELGNVGLMLLSRKNPCVLANKNP